MKNYAKIGNRKGRPAYRTPASFRYRQYVKNVKIRAKKRRGCHKNILK